MYQQVDDIEPLHSSPRAGGVFEDDLEGEVEIEDEVTPDDAHKALELLKRFVVDQGVVSDNLIECVTKLDILLGPIVRHRKQQKQMKIYDYFSR